MRHANHEKKQTNDERKRTTKSRKNQNVRKKEIFRKLENIRSERHQMIGDERKKKFKIVSQEIDKTTRNQTILSKSHQKCCPPRKILGTILEVEERRASINGPEKRKLMTINKTLYPRDDIERLYVSRKGERRLKIASIHQYDDSKTNRSDHK